MVDTDGATVLFEILQEILHRRAVMSGSLGHNFVKGNIFMSLHFLKPAH